MTTALSSHGSSPRPLPAPKQSRPRSARKVSETSYGSAMAAFTGNYSASGNYHYSYSVEEEDLERQALECAPATTTTTAVTTGTKGRTIPKSVADKAAKKANALDVASSLHDGSSLEAALHLSTKTASTSTPISFPGEESQDCSPFVSGSSFVRSPCAATNDVPTTCIGLTNVLSDHKTDQANYNHLQDSASALLAASDIRQKQSCLSCTTNTTNTTCTTTCTTTGHPPVCSVRRNVIPSSPSNHDDKHSTTHHTHHLHPHLHRTSCSTSTSPISCQKHFFDCCGNHSTSGGTGGWRKNSGGISCQRTTYPVAPHDHTHLGGDPTGAFGVPDLSTDHTDNPASGFSPCQLLSSSESRLTADAATTTTSHIVRAYIPTNPYKLSKAVRVLLQLTELPFLILWVYFMYFIVIVVLAAPHVRQLVWLNALVAGLLVGIGLNANAYHAIMYRGYLDIGMVVRFFLIPFAVSALSGLTNSMRDKFMLVFPKDPFELSVAIATPAVVVSTLLLVRLCLLHRNRVPVTPRNFFLNGKIYQ